MNDLYQWAIRHHVSAAAVQDLMALFGAHIDAGQPTTHAVGRSEAAIQNNVRLEAARKGMRLWRNNNGALKDERGVPVRYGLANDTAAVNKVIKSSDLIGIDASPITPVDVGQPRGRLVAIECKEAGWVYTGTEREVAQMNFIRIVNAMGGRALFVNREGML
jgi:hypothetical protein